MPEVNQHLIQLSIKNENMNTPSRKWAEDLQRHFSKEDIQMGNRHSKKWSASLIIKKKKCKSQLPRGITSHRSEWPSSKILQSLNAGEGVEKREPPPTLPVGDYCWSLDWQVTLPTDPGWRMPLQHRSVSGDCCLNCSHLKSSPCVYFSCHFLLIPWSASFFVSTDGVSTFRCPVSWT